MTVLVFGGTGTFGKLIVDHLNAKGFRALSVSRHGPIRGDVTSAESCRALLTEHRPSVVVHCAGPFSAAHFPLVEACEAGRIHYVDIAEDRAFVALLRSRSNDERWKKAGIAVVTGASSFPGISGALAKAALSMTKAESARAILFIGNRNKKGNGAVTTAFRQVGKSFPTRQGTLTAFGDRETIDLPVFGRRSVVTFESPEYEVFPTLGISRIVVKVGFELPLSTYLLPIVSNLPIGWVRSLARMTNWYGRSGGVILVELLSSSNEVIHREGIFSEKDGQSMAVLPCVWAVEKLARGSAPAGAFLVHELDDKNTLLPFLESHGYRRLKTVLHPAE